MYHKNDIVVFGRPNGEQTIGKVLKCNAKSIAIETLESRGLFGQRPAGQKWRVHPSLVRPATEDEIKSVTSQTVSKPAIPSPPSPATEAEIMQSIADCYCGLSPENLSCDGELPFAAIRQRRAAIMRQLNTLFARLGRRVTEDEMARREEQRKRA